MDARVYVKEKNNFSFRLFIFITESSDEITEDSLAAITELLLVKQQQRDEKKKRKKERLRKCCCREEKRDEEANKISELKRKYDKKQQQ